MKLVLLHAAKAMGLFGLSRLLTRRRLRILCYHGVWLGEGTFGNYLFMRPETFRARMRLLASLGYPVLGLDEAIERLAAGTLPPCATVITIDDGWYGTYRHMVDALAAERLPATLYACTYYMRRQRPVFTVAVQVVLASAPRRSLDLAALLGTGAAGPVNLDDPDQAARAAAAIIDHGEALADDDARQALLARLGVVLDVDVDALARSRVVGLMTEDELRDAARRGLDPQLHTHRHRFPEDPAALEREIADNRAVLEPIGGRPLRHLCYPSGEYDRVAWPVLERLGVRTATTTEQGMVCAGDPPLGLRRLLDGERVAPIEFEAEMCGLMEIKRRVRALLPA